jgi:hypothetical protein
MDVLGLREPYCSSGRQPSPLHRIRAFDDSAARRSVEDGGLGYLGGILQANALLEPGNSAENLKNCRYNTTSAGHRRICAGMPLGQKEGRVPLSQLTRNKGSEGPEDLDEATSPAVLPKAFPSIYTKPRPWYAVEFR